MTQTCELAIRALVVLGLEGNGRPTSPKRLASRLDCSPSYLAKTLRALVKSGILQSVRGAHGGFLLARPAADITLLEIVESSQGLLVANYCRAIAGHQDPVCGFHCVMRKLQEDTVATLSSWTLKNLLEQPPPEPPPGPPQPGALPCKMAFTGSVDIWRQQL